MEGKRAAVRWSDVKKQLQPWGEAELLGLVHDLFKLSAENRAFLAARLLGPSAVQPLLEPYRQRIERAFYKRSGIPQEKLQLGEARKAIREFQAATSDPAGTLELMLTDEQAVIALGKAQVDALFRRQADPHTLLDDRDFIPLLEAVVSAFEAIGVSVPSVEAIWDHAHAAYDRLCREVDPSFSFEETRELMRRDLVGPRRPEPGKARRRPR